MKTSNATRRDLRVVQMMLSTRNARPIRAPMSKPHLPFNLETDGSTTGGGAWFGGHALTMKWSDQLQSKDMAIAEARAVRIALQTWAPMGFINTTVHVWVDNQGLYHLLHGSRLQAPDQRLQEELVLIALTIEAYGVNIIPHWWDSLSNERADAASRLYDPVHGAKYKRKLEELRRSWLSEHRLWRWNNDSVNLTAEREAGRELLKLWSKFTHTVAHEFEWC